MNPWDQHIEQAEKGKGYAWLEQGGIVRTGSGGKHLYVLSDDPGKFVFQGHNGNPHGGEIQGIGSQCVAPPSIHPDTKEEYEWFYENWDHLPLVSDQELQRSYTPVKVKTKFKEGKKKEEKKGFSSTDAGDFGNDSTFYDYSTIDFIALFQSRSWVLEDKRLLLFSVRTTQHTENSDGTTSTVCPAYACRGTTFCLHGHCDHYPIRTIL